MNTTTDNPAALSALAFIIRALLRDVKETDFTVSDLRQALQLCTTTVETMIAVQKRQGSVPTLNDSTKQHSAEPWTVECHTDESVEEITGASDWTIKSADGYAVCWEGANLKNASSNARRIVACVNYCKGLTTEAMEENVAAGVLALDVMLDKDSRIESLTEHVNALTCARQQLQEAPTLCKEDTKLRQELSVVWDMFYAERSGTAVAIEQAVAPYKRDAERWQEVERRFDSSKTSASELVLQGLSLNQDLAVNKLAAIIDAALAAKEADHDA